MTSGIKSTQKPDHLVKNDRIIGDIGLELQKSNRYDKNNSIETISLKNNSIL